MIRGLVIAMLVCASAFAADRPNILWIFAEDMNAWMGCYGSEINKGYTPNFDKMAENGIRFERAFVPAPVCSPCRSAMMGGAPGIRFNAHEHRSSRGKRKIHLPEGMKLLPELMKETGYYTFNVGKTDYNFVWNEKANYSHLSSGKKSVVPWEEVKANQPFFGQIQTKGGKTNTGKIAADLKTDRSKVTIPGDYPQNEVWREAVAQHYDTVRMEDIAVGKILADLEKHGLAENTIVVYFSDHGAPGLLRHKQMVTEGGLRVPFLIAGDPKCLSGKGIVRDDLVNMLDLSATTLAWAGIEQPEWFEGQDLFAENFQPRGAVFSAVDRLDHTIGRSRTVRTDRFRYTRNYKLDRILLQPQYRDNRDVTKNLHALYQAGELDPKLKEIWFGERPAEEFYDVVNDPAQLNNLVGNPEYRKELKRHRKLLDHWLKKGDRGEGEEPPLELKAQTGQKFGRPVNPEYEVIRTDEDGDGLSTEWEKVMGRDPADGRLVFKFDCGGWQTEGWEPEGIGNNIAGCLGYLGFTLDSKQGRIVRNDLNVSATEADKAFTVSLKTSSELDVALFVNGRQPGQTLAVDPQENYQLISFELGTSNGWKGGVKSVGLQFNAAKGTWIEIDAIEVKR